MFGIQFMLLNLGIGIGGIVAATIVDVAEPATFTAAVPGGCRSPTCST